MSSEQRKVLEEIQRSKRLLKEGVAASIGMHTSTSNTSPLISTATTGFQAQVIFLADLLELTYYAINC